jgi:hypothetical protein
MKSLENVTGLQEMSLQEINEVNGGTIQEQEADAYVFDHAIVPAAKYVYGFIRGFLSI